MYWQQYVDLNVGEINLPRQSHDPEQDGTDETTKFYGHPGKSDSRSLASLSILSLPPVLSSQSVFSMTPN